MSFAMFVFVLCLVFIIVRVSEFSIIDFPFGFLYLLYKTIALLTKLWRHKINLHLTSTNDSIHDEEGTGLSRVMFTVVIFRCCRCSSECHLGFILPVLWKIFIRLKYRSCEHSLKVTSKISDISQITKSKLKRRIQKTKWMALHGSIFDKCDDIILIRWRWFG